MTAAIMTVMLVVMLLQNSMGKFLGLEKLARVFNANFKVSNERCLICRERLHNGRREQPAAVETTAGEEQAEVMRTKNQKYIHWECYEQCFRSMSPK